MPELNDRASRVSGSLGQVADVRPGLPGFTWRVVSLHMLTYFTAGLVAFFALDYRRAYETTELRYLMRPTASPWVAAGPALQVFRGLMFAVVLYPLASDLLRRKHSVLLLWGLFLGLAILGAAGPSPGSFEGIIYTRLPISLQLRGLPEVVIQTLLFSAGLVAWCRKPARWMNVASGIGVALVCLLGIAGFFAARAS